MEPENENEIYYGLRIDDAVKLLKERGVWEFYKELDQETMLHAAYNLQHLRTIRPEEILAFLGHAYFPPATSPSIIASYKADEEFRRNYLGNMTKAGCILRKVFGDAAFYKIRWYHSNPGHVSTHTLSLEPDKTYIREVVVSKRALLVLAFGEAAKTGVEEVVRGLRSSRRPPVINCPNPLVFGSKARLKLAAQIALTFQVH